MNITQKCQKWGRYSQFVSYYLIHNHSKNSVYNNKLKKFWLWDLWFDISENNEAFENDNQDSDIDISKTENNNQDWISKKKIHNDNLTN